MRVRFQFMAGDEFEEEIGGPLQPFMGWSMERMAPAFFYLASVGSSQGVLYPRIPLYRQMVGCRGVCLDCRKYVAEGVDPREVDNALAGHRAKQHDTAIIPDQIQLSVKVRPDGPTVAECRRWSREESNA